ncbi:MAG: GIY-YIG nuclease family protein [Caldilineaceae bacterium]
MRRTHSVVMTCGIYRIVNVKNGHFYLGSSIIIEKRYAQHMSDLRRGHHHSIYLQRAYDRHGEYVFTLDIVEECDESELLEIEQAYLDALSSSLSERMEKRKIVR